MFKVNIKNDGTITRRIGNEDVKLGTFNGYTHSDFAKNPNIFRASSFKLETGNNVSIAYGGIVDGKFKECCHLHCIWGKNCLHYGKANCMYNNDFKDVGFYILD